MCIYTGLIEGEGGGGRIEKICDRYSNLYNYNMCSIVSQLEKKGHEHSY